MHEGRYVAEADLNLTEDEWVPYLSLKDADRLDEVRRALRDED